MTVRTDTRAAKRTRRKVRADHLSMDEHVQRRWNASRSTKLADSLDLDGLGVVTVSQRKDGKLVVLDGQHRIKALLENSMGEWEVECDVYHGLTEAEEATIFRLLNNSRPTSVFDDYKVGLVANDREWVPIHNAVEKTGLKISDQSADGHVMCVQSLRSLYRSANGQPGDELVRETLELALEAWGAKVEAVDGKIVIGLGTVLRTYGKQIDHATLVKKLAKFPGGPSGLIGRARALRDIRPSPVGRLVAAVVVGIYNGGRRKKLAEL